MTDRSPAQDRLGNERAVIGDVQRIREPRAVARPELSKLDGLVEKEAHLGYRLCFLRGPKGIIELAERLN